MGVEGQAGPRLEWAGSGRPTGPGRWGRTVAFVTATPCAVLLAVQLLAVLLYPVLDDASGRAGGVGRSAIGLIGLFVLLLAVLAVRRTPALTWSPGVSVSRWSCSPCRRGSSRRTRPSAC